MAAKAMTAKYGGKCGKCGVFMPVGTLIMFDPHGETNNKVWHQSCDTTPAVVAKPVAKPEPIQSTPSKMFQIAPVITATMAERANHEIELAAYLGIVSDGCDEPEIEKAILTLQNMVLSLDAQIAALKTPKVGDQIRVLVSKWNSTGDKKYTIGDLALVTFAGIGKFGPCVALQSASGSFYLKPQQVEVVARPE